MALGQIPNDSLVGTPPILGVLDLLPFSIGELGERLRELSVRLGHEPRRQARGRKPRRPRGMKTSQAIAHPAGFCRLALERALAAFTAPSKRHSLLFAASLLPMTSAVSLARSNNEPPACSSLALSRSISALAAFSCSAVVCRLISSTSTSTWPRRSRRHCVTCLRSVVGLMLPSL